MTTMMRDIPLSKLVRSEMNVRRTGPDVRVDELAASIAAHGLLQGLSVSPVLDDAGAETGKFSVSGGSRRFAALKLLAKQKQIDKSYAVPCLIHAGNAEEASLAENVVREPLHPADQFEAFRRLVEEQGLGAEEIAARFGVTAHVVKQRLRLGNVSPRLMQIYRDGDLTLDQLKAFTITDDHIRQEQVYDNLSYNREPCQIRRELTRSHAVASDRRALFVSGQTYEEAGGLIRRDLFSDNDGGYFTDIVLLDRLATEKLQVLADDVKAREGWKWVSVHLDFPNGHGMRRSYPHPVNLSEEDETAYAAAKAAYDTLTEAYDSTEELPNEVDARMGELETLIETINARRFAYNTEDIEHGGVFVVLTYDGTARIERGFIRAEDEAPASDPEQEDCGSDDEFPADRDRDEPEVDKEATEPQEDDASDALKPISDILARNLSAHRTLALRLTLGEQPDKAVIVLTHALAVQAFYRGTDAACLDILATSTSLGVDEAPAAQALEERHQAWAMRLPPQTSDLWSFIIALEISELMALLAHCAALTVNALKLSWERKPLAHQAVEHLATLTGLDMTAHWTPDVEHYFGSVTKARILAAVRDAVNAEAAEQITNLKKPEMAIAAAELVKGTGWLPEPLRTARPSSESPDRLELLETDIEPSMLEAAE